MNKYPEDLIKIELSTEEAIAFRIFQAKHDIIAPICGYLDSLKIMDISNSQLVLDVDQNGVIKHMSITKHFR